MWESFGNSKNLVRTAVVSDGPGTGLLPQAAFLRLLGLERKRAERSQRSFVLMLLKSSGFCSGPRAGQTLDQIATALFGSIRETDSIGWYDTGTAIGVIFTEIGLTPPEKVIDILSKKMAVALRDAMGAEQFAEAALEFFLYPEDSESEEPRRPLNSALYPDLARRTEDKKAGLRIKRLIDIIGSLFAIILCAPVFLLIGLAVKLSSKGPVLFRQQRIGHYGKSFTFLKFRSMYQNNDHTIHQEYIKRLIAARVDEKASQGEGASVVYKLTNDPRITKVGRFLRRTSLDELPQLFNVLRGEMSLVGPRPPIPYEFAGYAPWHRNRLVVVKPGITGLWQVEGRSQVTFDEMVRLDLRYAASWSLWLDFSILLQTPRAVLTCQGAY